MNQLQENQRTDSELGVIEKAAYPVSKLMEVVSGRFNHKDFASHARASANANGCIFLFDFPASLIEAKADQAAAILCPGEEGNSIVFLTYRSKAKTVNVLQADEAPDQLVDFVYSFARVLSYLPDMGSQSVQ